MMRKFAWLLALPYVVQVSSQVPECAKYESTSSYTVECVDEKAAPDRHQLKLVTNENDRYSFYFTCEGSKDRCAWVYDLAESLNMGHERRTADYTFPTPTSQNLGGKK